MSTLLTRSSDNFLDFFNLLKDKELAVSYFGDFSVAIKNAILADVRRKLDLLENKVLLKKRIYTVADESFDNIINYARNSGQDNYKSLFSLFRESSSYVLMIGNQVEEGHLTSLHERMKLIGEMDPEQLNVEYKKVMASPMAADADGAGLGIIIMAMRSGNNIDYQIEKLESGDHFFIIRIRIS